LIGGFLGRFAEPYDAGRLAAHLEQCSRSGASGTVELTLRPREGESATVQISSRPAPAHSDFGPVVHLAITDISKLKESQRVLEEINREQEAFNYSISHDLRAPLVTIKNYANIVIAEHADRLDEEGRMMVQRMQGAALRMEETLKHLLQYSTLGREPIALEPVDLEGAVDELLIEHRALIQQTRATIEVARPLPKVRGARTLLMQVLTNLLTNALKYTEAGVAPQVWFLAADKDNTVVLSVVDRGIGIEPRHHEKIFNLFERLHGYSQYPGSGVGLAIARRAVERMQGRIWCESEPGKGSTFCVELPKA
jgi:signal transduction histidine kinase